uniref:hypothetical protein n=1 Tax=Serratia liquefaciens TaxID=614 RepID=UPI002360663A
DKMGATETIKHKGVLEGLDLSRKDAEDMIMAARVAAGWVKAEDLIAPEAEPTEHTEPQEPGEEAHPE